MPLSGDGAGGPRGDNATPETPAVTTNPNNKASVVGTQQLTIDFENTPLVDLVKFIAKITCKNFILENDLKGSINIISHKPVSVAESYEAFLSALEVHGYTTVTVGALTKIVATSSASNAPLRVNQGGSIPYTDNYVTKFS